MKKREIYFLYTKGDEKTEIEHMIESKYTFIEIIKRDSAQSRSRKLFSRVRFCTFTLKESYAEERERERDVTVLVDQEINLFKELEKVLTSLSK